MNKNVKIQKKISPETTTHIFFCSQEKFDTFWRDYFNLQTDYSIFKQRILASGDAYLRNAANFGSGLRILRQDLWETMVSFIISQQNNIPRITHCIKQLCALNGNKFPTAEDFLSMRGEKLKAVKLGYREDYLLRLSEAVVEGKFDLDVLRNMSYEEALQYLKTLRGVGEKVANCIALFGLHHLEAFPIDTWMKKIIVTHYDGHFSLEEKGLKDIAGLVQQYMFFYERSLQKHGHI